MDFGPSTVYPLAVPIALGEGVPKTVPITTPAAGADWTQTVPGEGAWLLQSFVATLTTSAAAANRVPRLRITDGNVIVFQKVLAVQTASLALIHSGAVGSGESPATIATNGGSTIGLPSLILPPGFVISVSTGAVDVGDQWSAVRLYIFELPYGPTGYARGPVEIPIPEYATGG